MELMQVFIGISYSTSFEKINNNKKKKKRLIPKIVVHVESEEEVQKIIKLANQTKISITFRAAGTSLSGNFIVFKRRRRIINLNLKRTSNN